MNCEKTLICPKTNLHTKRILQILLNYISLVKIEGIGIILSGNIDEKKVINAIYNEKLHSTKTLHNVNVVNIINILTKAAVMIIIYLKEEIMNQKQLKFKELAEKRVNNAIKNIQLIGNLSNTNNYEYTDEEVSKIFKALKEEIQTSEARFRKTDRRKKFKL